ncbi:hypothetical protein F5Y17DRAFT_245518 [Xylariaceae sp. FL0594]|nr:hypothetical protein F5Y17DRAFT_245518 [Xylariaceae sp. FL0594]
MVLWSATDLSLATRHSLTSRPPVLTALLFCRLFHRLPTCTQPSLDPVQPSHHVCRSTKPTREIARSRGPFSSRRLCLAFCCRRSANSPESTNWFNSSKCFGLKWSKFPGCPYPIPSRSNCPSRCQCSKSPGCHCPSSSCRNCSTWCKWT